MKFLGTAQLTQGYRGHEFTPVDALAAWLARASAVQPTLNAMVHIDGHGAAQAANASRERWARGQPPGPA